jgi:hypothetical protein
VRVDATTEDTAAAARAATVEVEAEVEVLELDDAVERELLGLLLLLPKIFRFMPARVAVGTRTLMARAAAVLFRMAPPTFLPLIVELMLVLVLDSLVGESMSGRC